MRTNLQTPNFGATHAEKTRAQKYAESSSSLKRTLYKGFRLMQTTTRRITEFFKPTPQTPVSAKRLDQGIYFYKPPSNSSASGFVSGREPSSPRTPSQQDGTVAPNDVTNDGGEMGVDAALKQGDASYGNGKKIDEKIRQKWGNRIMLPGEVKAESGMIHLKKSETPAKTISAKKFRDNGKYSHEPVVRQPRTDMRKGFRPADLTTPSNPKREPQATKKVTFKEVISVREFIKGSQIVTKTAVLSCETDAAQQPPAPMKTKGILKDLLRM